MTKLDACPDELELCGLTQGTLSTDRSVVIRAHLGECDVCRVAVAAILESSDDASAAVDRYELRSVLGAGAMGEVFLAYDRVLGREVALKLLRDHDKASRHEVQKRVTREARALASLSHPNVIAVYDQGVLDERPFLVMEYVRGRTLRQWLAERQPDPRSILEALVQAARGLAAAHDLGIVHGDFKPENVLVGDDGRVRVGDFGLARWAASATAGGDEPVPVASATAPGHDRRVPLMSGTPAYMAPEQLTHGIGDARSDQYAFAITLRDALAAHRSRAMRAVITRALAANPDERYASMHELVDCLERAAARRRRRIATWSAACVAIGAAAIGARLLWPNDRGAAPAALHEACTSPIRGCAAPLVCRFPSGDMCGVAGEPGSCIWPVDTCDDQPDPVCACDGTTYVNACAAHRERITIAYHGECRSCIDRACDNLVLGRYNVPAYCGDNTASGARVGLCWPRPATCRPRDAQACGIDGRTYASECEAHHAGVSVEHEGACH
jgi:tRNA A-37 threonylcarbamoyl transferase component Bud32